MNRITASLKSIRSKQLVTFRMDQKNQPKERALNDDQKEAHTIDEKKLPATENPTQMSLATLLKSLRHMVSYKRKSANKSLFKLSLGG